MKKKKIKEIKLPIRFNLGLQKYEPKLPLRRTKKKVKVKMRLVDKIIVISILLFFILLVFYLKSTDFSEYNKGYSELENFCTEKCGNKDLVFFKNHTDFNYIECECVFKVVLGDESLFKTSIRTVDLFFDSATLEEINKEEVEKRKSE